jgi:hypothetical protein
MRRCRFPWGGFLILFGVLFLISHLLPFRFSIWNAFVPLLIIWWGLRLLARDRERPLPPRQATKPQPTGEVKYLSLPIKQVEEAHIRLKHGGGKLEIHGQTAPDELLAGTFGERGVVYKMETAIGDVLHLDMQSPVTLAEPTEEQDWVFGLNQEIPMSLNVSTAATQAALDLSALQLTEILLHSGASDLTVILPAQARYTLVQVESGTAAVRLYVPEGVAAHIRAREGLAAVQVDEWRFPPVGRVYESKDYDTAEHRVDIYINAGASNISIH